MTIVPMQIRVTMLSPMHIGGEVQKNTTAARPMLKKNGFPYIPATTIKGRLRHHVEMLAKTRGLSICRAPKPDDMCHSDVGLPCPVCQLFGSPWYTSPLYFDDLVLLPEQQHIFHRLKHPPSQTRYSVRLNRRRRVAQDRTVFDTELFEPGIPWEFTGEILYRGDHEEDLFLLHLAAGIINSIGSSRSRGLGWAEISITPSFDEATIRERWEAW